jgi:Divergent InlB B-repeat domain/Calcineurin-like phosphoesterase
MNYIIRFIIAGLAFMVIPARMAGQFTAPELLGKPTDQSVTVNVVPSQNMQIYYEYGTSPGTYTGQTATTSATSGQPHETVITGLSANTRYYYRMQYSTNGGGSWTARTERSFHTQRAPGSTFVFTVISDNHNTLNSTYTTALTNILNDQADFHLDLGDTFMPDNAASQATVNTTYLNHRAASYLGVMSHSIPVFLASGNHENEEGWNLDDTPNSIGVFNIQARKAYFPTPTDEGTAGFYSGNTDPLARIDEATYGNELREDYYAWEWGDALFIVIDEFQYTTALPYAPGTAGEGSDDSQTGDQWSWTLGRTQYDWLKATLEGSSAKYKFVFSHNMLGGITRPISGVSAGYVRGGAEAAKYFEWGGYNSDGTTWGFDTYRPGWGGKPIHQLFVENDVSAYFHGHDHQYVYERRDGVVYQEVPMPTTLMTGFTGIYTEGTYAEYETIEMLGNSGHLRITVAPGQATVDYVRSNTTGVAYSYNILPGSPGITYDLTIGVSPAGSGTTNPAIGVHNYNENTVVNITAIPGPGYAFGSWAGDVAAPGSASTTVTMNASKTVTANFIPVVTGSVSGDFNGDDVINSTDALIVLLCDAGITSIAQYCPCNCGDANGDGIVNSTDALIILLYDAGISVPYPVGSGNCPAVVTPCAGCTGGK